MTTEVLVSNTTEVATPAENQQPLPNRGFWGFISFAAVFVLVGFRTASERAMMNEFGSDPQMAIWMVFMIVQVTAWALAGLACAGLLVLTWNRQWGFRITLVMGFGWMAAICWSSYGYRQARGALVEARDPGTSPERLLQLASFRGIQAGYELDNRIASNSSASHETLKLLYDRGELGTLMVLARNPETPHDILQLLAEYHLQNEWIRKGLAGNPSLPDTAHEKLKAFVEQ
jgi:hypothetical protein